MALRRDENVQTFVKFIIDSGVAGWVIVGFGAVSAVIIFERVKLLFMKYKLNMSEFTLKVETLLLSGKAGEALTFCAAHADQPLPKVMKAILERADRDDKSIEQAQMLMLNEVLPPLGSRLGYLAVLANVSTLVGLLGTIFGLIMSFQAVSFADPSQKQMLLSQGISLAMNTTALGLSVAIPVMLAYTVLLNRQNKLCDEIVGQSGRVVDHLTNRHYENVKSA